LTAEAAQRVLQEGGNAFDAVLAAMCAACVAEPVLASLGGGGFLLAQNRDGKDLVYDFFVHTPRYKRPADELEFRPMDVDFGSTTQSFHIGLGAIATPGLVRGLFEIHRELGRMPMREVVAPAIDLANQGVRVSPFQSYVFRLVAPSFTATPEARALFGSPADADKPVGENDVLVATAMADALEVLAIEGEDLFYRGEMAQAIVRMCEEQGGHLRAEDLEAYRVHRREPLVLQYRDAVVATNPPPSYGGMLMAFALRVLDRGVRMARHSFGSVEHLDLLAAVMELTNQARVECCADDPTSAAGRLFDPDLLERYAGEVPRHARFSRGTTHINVMDDRGNVASMTLSNGEGSGHLVPGTGIMLNNMLGEEDLCPAGFHNWPEDTRMSSMMAPTLIHWRDGRTVATGSGGSKRIRTALLQILVNLIDHRMGVEDAVTSPRLFLEDGVLSIEGGFRPSVVQQLIERYPQHQVWEELNLFFGGAHILEHRAGAYHGAGDPRREGVCIVVR
jgi:gamma-glutamyltranspeptidase/glutathione hydrolase